MTTKEKYVRQHMRMGDFPTTADAIIDSIPASLFDSLTGEQLVVVADALHAAHQAGKAVAEREILAEGAIYSAGRMRELV